MGKRVKILAYETGVLYDSYRHAGRELDLAHNNIMAIINNYDKSLKGVHFFHEDFEVDPSKITYYIQEKKVYCWELKTWFNSLKEAAIATSASENNIGRIINNPNKISSNYHWCDSENYFDGFTLTGGRGSNIANKDAVFNYTTKAWYPSKAEAAREYNLANTISISEVTNNPYRRAAGCHWCDTEDYFDGVQLSSLSMNSLEGTAPELEIKEYIKTLGFECTKSRKVLKSGKELDILIPGKDLAIEYNGSRWHSDRFKTNQKYHQDKSLEAKELGIELIHIYEFDFFNLQKKQKIFDYIRHKLGLSSISIYARQCEIKEITDTKLVRQFLDDNHIQGFSPSILKIGLFFKDELVSLMTFNSPHRSNSKYEWELTRFCIKKDHRIPGAASKLLAYFENNYNPNNLVTYANLDYSSGKLYKTLNFAETAISCNSYVYTKGSLVISKRSAERKLLPKLLGDKFDPNLSEYENMKANNYYKVNLAGIITYVKFYNK